MAEVQNLCLQPYCTNALARGCALIGAEWMVHHAAPMLTTLALCITLLKQFNNYMQTFDK
jgi:hypothetical protein